MAKISELHNFADDNTITYSSEAIEQLVKNLKEGPYETIRWFWSNKMIVNPGKFQVIIIDKKEQSNTATEIYLLKSYSNTV